MRIGLVGFGGMGRHHARQVAANPRLDLAAISDPAPQSRAHAASDHGIPVYANAPAMIAETPLDGVLIAAPTVSHAALIELAAGSGLHVFCEKPLVLRTAEAPDVKRAVEESGITFGFGLVLRYMAPYRTAHELIRTGSIGKIMMAHGRYGAQFSDSSYVFDAETGGGLLNEHTIHMIDCLEYLLGPARCVAAVLGRSHNRSTEDNATMLFRFSDELGAGLAGSGTTSIPSVLELTGSDGELVITGNSRLERIRSGEREIVTLDPAPDPYYQEVEEWRLAIEEQRVPRTGLGEALRITSVLAAIRTAAASGQTVEITP